MVLLWYFYGLFDTSGNLLIVLGSCWNILLLFFLEWVHTFRYVWFSAVFVSAFVSAFVSVFVYMARVACMHLGEGAEKIKVKKN